MRNPPIGGINLIYFRISESKLIFIILLIEISPALDLRLKESQNSNRFFISFYCQD